MFNRENADLSVVMSEEHLPSHRNFLLRLSDASVPQLGIYRGKIEHIPSGRSTQFDSLKALGDFMQEALAKGADQSPCPDTGKNQEGEPS